MKFERKIKRLAHRDWGDIRVKWLGYLPDFDPPGSPPEEPLSNFMALGEIAQQIPENGEYRDEIPGLREAIFREGVFLLHKAAHVIGACQIHLEKGMPSWALSGGYHGAFFAAKAIVGLLGVSFPEIENKTILIDVWPDLPKLSARRRGRGEKPPNEMNFIKLPKLQHYHIWQILQRLLRTMNTTLWEDHLISSLDNIPHKEFARQRNMLHYNNCSWIFHDLHAYLLDESFKQKLISVTENMLKPQREGFSVVLGFVLLLFGYLLFKDVASSAPILQDEFGILEEWLSLDCNIMYKEFSSQIEAWLAA